MNELINSLISASYLKTPRIIEAFRQIDRADFVLPEMLYEAYGNYPLPIGYGQTISQPLTVAFMFELLQPEPGQKILDVGAGSGWTSTLLAHIVSYFTVIPSRRQAARNLKNDINGKVYAVERIPELCEFGKNNVAKYNFVEKGIVEFICADGTKGLKEQAPFDRIIIAAAAETIPPVLKKQLKVKGRLVIPVQSSIFLVVKEAEDKFFQEEFPGFAFVPLIED